MSSSQHRTEKDSLGERKIPSDALWGIHTMRAVENFPLSGRRVNELLIRAFGVVKLACAKTNQELGVWDKNPDKASAIAQASEELGKGQHSASIVVDAFQGGAGTSLNMNVNEVLANRALQILSKPPGSYEIISPLDDINRSQSTNDTYPTALKVACLWALKDLEARVLALQEAFQDAEKRFAGIVKVGRTEYQDAVLTTLGHEMSAYAEAFNRDRWRIYKCEERLRVVNLGGTAIGTGLGAPRQYIFRVTEILRELTGLNLARAENLIEATQNTDVFTEVSGILSAYAVSLLKVCSDIRFLSSGPESGIGELVLKPLQAGSSIMPGKVNPVIPEAVSQVAIKALANHQAISQACASGHLELNAFLPLVADCLLESLEILARGGAALAGCVRTIEADAQVCRTNVENSSAAATALVPLLGYDKASEIACSAKKAGISIRRYVIEKNLLSLDVFENLISPEAVTKLGS